MAGPAQITSVEALEAFRADLIVFLGQMSPVVDEVSGEVVRLKFWMQNEQRPYWQNQLKLRRRRLEEAQAELFNARMSTIQDSCILQTMAVQRIQRAVQEAEQKLMRMKKWERELDNLADPLLKQVEQLQGYLASDMAKAVAFLTQTSLALAAYTDVRPAGSPPPAAPPPDHTQTTT